MPDMPISTDVQSQLLAISTGLATLAGKLDTLQATLTGMVALAQSRTDEIDRRVSRLEDAWTNDRTKLVAAIVTVSGATAAILERLLA